MSAGTRGERVTRARRARARTRTGAPGRTPCLHSAMQASPTCISPETTCNPFTDASSLARLRGRPLPAPRPARDPSWRTAALPRRWCTAPTRTAASGTALQCATSQDPAHCLPPRTSGKSSRSAAPRSGAGFCTVKRALSAGVGWVPRRWMSSDERPGRRPPRDRCRGPSAAQRPRQRPLYRCRAVGGACGRRRT